MADGARRTGMAPRNPVGPSPPRRPGSIRRTSTIETSWPNGPRGLQTVVGRARDAVTPAAGGRPHVSAHDEFRAQLQDRTIVEIEATPPRPWLGQLVGARGGGHLRIKLDELAPEEHAGATPLHLLIDDVSGASLVAGWAWMQWPEGLKVRAEAQAESSPNRGPREGVCVGFAPGSSALRRLEPSGEVARVVDLRHPEDPDGWHDFTEQDGAVGMRRARRIDVWRDDQVRIEAGFQDSATHPDGGRVGLHEYRLKASADPRSGKLLSIEVAPHILPFAECPAAAASASRILGAELKQLRVEVLKTLPGTLGCTHLNDMMRALAEAPALLERLDAALQG